MSYYNPVMMNYYPIQNCKYRSIPEEYIEDSLCMNIGKVGIFHMSFPDSQQERDKVFQGLIVRVSRDHVVINDMESCAYLLPLIYLNYVEFKENYMVNDEVLKCH